MRCRAPSRLERELERKSARRGAQPADAAYHRAGLPPEIITAEDAARMRAFATGTALFRRAGLVGEHYLGIALELRVKIPRRTRPRPWRRSMRSCCRSRRPAEPFSAIRRVGTPWLDAWLERQTGTATKKVHAAVRDFSDDAGAARVPFLARAGRHRLTLGAVVAMAVGLADIFGWSNTVVSTIVPLTVMVTTTATLVYIHSRYMEPDDAPTSSRASGAGTGQ
jgi:uncharacterized protein